MSKFKHTPGPWTVGCDGYNANNVYYCNDAVAMVYGIPSNTMVDAVGPQSGVGTANATLIAAAPELLAAAKTVLEGLNARIDSAPPNAVPLFSGIAALHDAIAKAEGQS